MHELDYASNGGSKWLDRCQASFSIVVFVSPFGLLVQQRFGFVDGGSDKNSYLPICDSCFVVKSRILALWFICRDFCAPSWMNKDCIKSDVGGTKFKSEKLPFDKDGVRYERWKLKRDFTFD